jgi:hypothetical protein
LSRIAILTFDFVCDGKAKQHNLGNRHPEKNKHGAFIPKNVVKLLADKTDKSFHCFFYLKFKVSGFEVVKPKIILISNGLNFSLYISC